MSACRADKVQAGGDELQVKSKKFDEEIHMLEHQVEAVSSLALKLDGSTLSSQVVAVFADLLDSLVVDVAAECHRAAKLGLDHRALSEDWGETIQTGPPSTGQLSDTVTAAPTGVPAGPAAGADSTKYTVDVFGQTHPPVATESFDCHNCGRPIAAGRYAPHLEKCMGKGRNASRVASRNISATQLRRQRASPIPSALAGSAGAGVGPNRTPNRTPTLTPEGSARSGMDYDQNTSEESLDDEVKDCSYGPRRAIVPQQRRGAVGAPLAGGTASGLSLAQGVRSAGLGQGAGLRQGSAAAAAGCRGPGRFTGTRTGKRGSNKKLINSSTDFANPCGAAPSSRVAQSSGATLATVFHQAPGHEAKVVAEGQGADLWQHAGDLNGVSNSVFPPLKLPQAVRSKGKKGIRNGETVKQSVGMHDRPDRQGNEIAVPAAASLVTIKVDPGKDAAVGGPTRGTGIQQGIAGQPESTKPRSRARGRETMDRTGVKPRTSQILTRSVSLSEAVVGVPPNSGLPTSPGSISLGSKEPHKNGKRESPELVFNTGWAGSEPATPMPMKGPRASKGGLAATSVKPSGTPQTNDDPQATANKPIALTFRSSVVEPLLHTDQRDSTTFKQNPQGSFHGGPTNAKPHVWVGRTPVRQTGAPGQKSATVPTGLGSQESMTADEGKEMGQMANGQHIVEHTSRTATAGVVTRERKPGDEQGRKRQRPPPRPKPSSIFGTPN